MTHTSYTCFLHQVGIWHTLFIPSKCWSSMSFEILLPYPQIFPKICPLESISTDSAPTRHLTLPGLAVVREHCELADLWQRGTAASVAGAGHLRWNECSLLHPRTRNNLVNLSMSFLSPSLSIFLHLSPHLPIFLHLSPSFMSLSTLWNDRIWLVASNKTGAISGNYQIQFDPFRKPAICATHQLHSAKRR